MRAPRSSSPSPPRRGIVLLGVLVVIVILALIAYQYSDRMLAEYQAASNAHRTAQARHFADSGVHYVAMLVASPDSIANNLSGNPFDNPTMFKDIQIPDAENLGAGGRFTLVAPLDPDQSTTGGAFRAGVTDEAGKININAFMKRDPTGQQLYDMLSKLPNMTEELAASIVDWVDSDTSPREGGAEDDYYSGQSSGYRCKNGPLDSLDELLLVKGMTRELLYGSDLNRNGLTDAGEGDASDRGLAAFLTVTSREANRDPTGQPFANVNGDDLTVLVDTLGPQTDEGLVKFIILYRQYGPLSSTGAPQSLGSSIASLFSSGKKTTSTATQTIAGDLGSFQPDMNRKATQKLTSFFDLVGAQVSVPNADRRKPATVYTSPIADTASLAELLPKLFLTASLNDDAEIPARININTASREVLTAVGLFSDADVQTILSTRPKWSTSEPPGPEFQTPVWLASQLKLPTATLRNLEKIVTTKSQVFHMQVVGRFESGNGPISRVEAIVDANFGRPRIVFYRDWTELGRTTLP
jgi:type II secretory pathway component PulK